MLVGFHYACLFKMASSRSTLTVFEILPSHLHKKTPKRDTLHGLQLVYNSSSVYRSELKACIFHFIGSKQERNQL